MNRWSMPLNKAMPWLGPLLWGGCLVLSVRGEEPSPAPKPLKVSRADLATAYLRLERAYFAQRVDEPDRSAINKAFDQSTMAFFQGRFAEAVSTIDQQTLHLLAEPKLPAAAAMRVRLSVEPPTWLSTQPIHATARLLPLYDLPQATAGEVALELRWVRGDEILRRIPVRLQTSPGQTAALDVPLEFAAEELAPAQYQLQLAVPDGLVLNAVRVNVVTRSLDQERTANEQRLARIQLADPKLSLALASCQARNQLLSDTPSATNSAQFLADLVALDASLPAEIAALEQGQDPYARRAGDYWRVLATGKRNIPMRVFAPPPAVEGKAVPLVIVLHGAGGDENLFFDGYGVGLVKQLAMQHGCLLASPTTNSFGGDPRHFDLLIESLASNYVLDRERIYVMGHSMGAGATAGLARARAEQIAAACCLAGGNASSKDKLPPLLAVVAEWDGVIPPKTLLPGLEKAAAAGQPIEIRTMAGYGHTLVVGAALPDAFAWLLRHQRNAAPATPAN